MPFTNAKKGLSGLITARKEDAASRQRPRTGD